MLIPDLLEKVKPISTKWMRKTFPEIGAFKWQEGYGAFSVGRSTLQATINYIRNQEEHHKIVSYKEELISLLEAQGILYDPSQFLD